MFLNCLIFSPEAARSFLIIDFIIFRQLRLGSALEWRYYLKESSISSGWLGIGLRLPEGDFLWRKSWKVIISTIKHTNFLLPNSLNGRKLVEGFVEHTPAGLSLTSWFVAASADLLFNCIALPPLQKFEHGLALALLVKVLIYFQTVAGEVENTSLFINWLGWPALGFQKVHNDYNLYSVLLSYNQRLFIINLSIIYSLDLGAFNQCFYCSDTNHNTRSIFFL